MGSYISVVDQLAYCKSSTCAYSGKWKGCMHLIKDMCLWSVATPTNIWARVADRERMLVFVHAS